MTWYSSNALGKTWDRIKKSRGREGRRSPSVGLDGVTAEKFDTHLEQNIAEIHRLLSKADREDPSFPAYRFAPFRIKTISSEPGKLRQIHIPRIRDQIVLRAMSDEIIRLVVQEYPDFLKASPRKITKQVIASREKGKCHILRTDIKKYYPSIPHSSLLKKLERTRVDRTILELIKQALATPLRDIRKGKSADQPTTIGTATGTSLSTVLSEFYLIDLADSIAMDEVDLVRYVDDIILLAFHPNQIPKAQERLVNELERRGLCLSSSKTVKKSFDEGFEFLGFWFEGKKVMISKAKALKWGRTYHGIVRKFARCIRQSSSKEKSVRLLECMVRELNREISGATGMQVPYYSLADDLSPLKDLDRQIRVILGGIFRRLGKKMQEPFRIESAYSWAWKYKKHYLSAMNEAQRRFPTIELDPRKE